MAYTVVSANDGPLKPERAVVDANKQAIAYVYGHANLNGN